MYIILLEKAIIDYLELGSMSASKYLKKFENCV